MHGMLASPGVITSPFIITAQSLHIDAKNFSQPRIYIKKQIWRPCQVIHPKLIISLHQTILNEPQRSTCKPHNGTTGSTGNAHLNNTEHIQC
jgi:hypothetical protein